MVNGSNIPRGTEALLGLVQTPVLTGVPPRSGNIWKAGSVEQMLIELSIPGSPTGSMLTMAWSVLAQSGCPTGYPTSVYVVC